MILLTDNKSEFLLKNYLSSQLDVLLTNLNLSPIRLSQNKIKKVKIFCKLPILGYPLLDGRQSAPV